ncbi:hypothetical protein ABE493_05450 [Stenotrophomonas terrae]|uniref:hypothetical protein n=1 Tax=Stenotrophomonas terrae TaxID=405446 RepID=UPI003207DA1F
MNASPPPPKAPSANVPEMIIATVAGVGFGVKTDNFLAGIFIGVVLGVILSLIGSRIRARNKP